MTTIQTLEEAKEVITLQAQTIKTLQNRLHNLDQKRNRWRRKFDERGNLLKEAIKIIKGLGEEQAYPDDKFNTYIEEFIGRVKRFNTSTDTIVDDENTETLSPSRTTEYS